MRTFMDPEDWEGKWIAGFSSADAGNGFNALVYLMKVKDAFNSQSSLWLSDEIPDVTKQAKSAQCNIFGDIFQPRKPIGDEFDPQSYFPPIKGHVHEENDGWHKDINYDGCGGRKAALLIGDPDYSFLWNQPMIFYDGGRLHRGQKKIDLQTLLNGRLRE